jgi:hypothetical protein
LLSTARERSKQREEEKAKAEEDGKINRPRHLSKDNTGDGIFKRVAVSGFMLAWAVVAGSALTTFAWYMYTSSASYALYTQSFALVTGNPKVRALLGEPITKQASGPGRESKTISAETKDGYNTWHDGRYFIQGPKGEAEVQVQVFVDRRSNASVQNVLVHSSKAKPVYVAYQGRGL